jgi:ribosome modulation factor
MNDERAPDGPAAAWVQGYLCGPAGGLPADCPWPTLTYQRTKWREGFDRGRAFRVKRQPRLPLLPGDRA